MTKERVPGQTERPDLKIAVAVDCIECRIHRAYPVGLTNRGNNSTLSVSSICYPRMNRSGPDRQKSLENYLHSGDDTDLYQ
jgi:hypothetical protein